jgi:cytochrome c
VDDFRYSEAMANAEIVWNEETLTAYLRDPRGYMPGNRMAFAGLSDEQAIDNLLAYLRQATDPDSQTQ